MIPFNFLCMSNLDTLINKLMMFTDLTFLCFFRFKVILSSS